MRLRQTLRIARWEVTKGASSLDRRTALALVVSLLVLGAVAPMVASQGATPNDGLYRVGVTQDSQYYGPVREERSLRAVDPTAGTRVCRDVELLVDGPRVTYCDTEKGRAALAALRSAVRAYNDQLMAKEPDQAAAFPVRVSLEYVEQAGPSAQVGGSSDAATGGSASSTAGSGGNASGTGDGAGGDGGSGTAADGAQASGASGPLPATGGLFGSEGQTGSPAAITPPFPLQSLLLAFAFLLPLNVVTQAYGSSVIDERIDRRGELLLVSPASTGDVVAGKTLPYLLGTLLVVAGVAAVMGGGPVTVLAIAPVAVLFLATSFVAGMFARSFKELTFVTVTGSVLIMTYAFVPAIFTNVHPIAAISPLSLVVKDLTGAPIGAGEFAVATLPMTLAAGVLFALGTGVYREEDMFAQRSPPAKAVDALAAHLRRPRDAALWSALFIPFVLVAELLAIALLFVLPVAVSLPLLLAVVAVVEELAKSLHVYAGFARGRFDTRLRPALLVGAFSGVGFFVGEKLGLVVQLVGLPNLELGRAAFSTSTASTPVVAATLLLAPLALHVVTASISAYGARLSRRHYLAALLVAAGVHFAYNLTVVTTLV